MTFATTLPAGIAVLDTSGSYASEETVETDEEGVARARITPLEVGTIRVHAFIGTGTEPENEIGRITLYAAASVVEILSEQLLRTYDGTAHEIVPRFKPTVRRRGVRHRVRP
ncbi:MAG: hypothetical protein U5J97_10245 [Trueperaceae bacterium]|nr:hypothetical protein [Trueperaceae bacterium]